VLSEEDRRTELHTWPCHPNQIPELQSASDTGVEVTYPCGSRHGSYLSQHNKNATHNVA
jgi:hypothetical protein